VHKKVVNFLIVSGVVIGAAILLQLPNSIVTKKGNSSSVPFKPEEGKIIPTYKDNVNKLSFVSAESFVSTFWSLFKINGCYCFSREPVFSEDSNDIMDSYVSSTGNIVIYMGKDDSVQSVRCINLSEEDAINVRLLCKSEGYSLKEVNNGFVIEYINQ